ncbi:Inhibitor of growth protein 2 [Araneus ventricosus]|uniref:Inhibitor of growth protein 2 n=1 Tax=Araneus ventricosus TaxID=182803 RepID=A0A4Y2C6P7_ARAVE|nr:Inhibitor of growth protein 2 [Araneus ventricosus]
MKTRYDSGATGHHFKEGDQVFMYNPKRQRGLSPKLRQNWEGPYTIVKKLHDVIYRVQRSPNAKPKQSIFDRLGSPWSANAFGVPPAVRAGELSAVEDLRRENETQNENNKTEQPERPTKRSRRQRHVDMTLRDDSGHERHEKEIPAPTTSKNKKKKKRKTKTEKEHEAPPIDPPIDPNEPTYCLCDQVSFGEMIGCDNDGCDREWFHFSCVGLTTKPKGKWYCPSCRGDRSNQMRPKAV